ncbi:hypothetical protein L798_04461 [Zootermopsis nevadensis]|uniref:Uncharacterized protein n=1 Tax=Zootermopsis nevadensis TaxID=136037 RepID=A0A067QFG5_ZOONE|nr:hypothetical protein L798_04461 [Zootermopsis nevadensis]
MSFQWGSALSSGWDHCSIWVLGRLFSVGVWSASHHIWVRVRIAHRAVDWVQIAYRGIGCRAALRFCIAHPTIRMLRVWIAHRAISMRFWIAHLAVWVFGSGSPIALSGCMGLDRLLPSEYSGQDRPLSGCMGLDRLSPSEYSGQDRPSRHLDADVDCPSRRLGIQVRIAHRAIWVYGSLSPIAPSRWRSASPIVTSSHQSRYSGAVWIACRAIRV